MNQARIIIQDHLPYPRFLGLMEGLVEARHRGLIPDVLILTEHEPVVTLGLRTGTGDILGTPEALQARGVEVYRVRRGGLATCHGPGQLMAYPIFNLRGLGCGVHRFVNLLEEVIIRTLADFKIQADRRDGYRGVWAGPEKIASIGLGVRRGIVSHGLGLNYGPDLSPFELINPCGLNNVKMTSMHRLLGEEVDQATLSARLVHHFELNFRLEFTHWPISEAYEIAERASQDESDAISKANDADNSNINRKTA